MDFLCTRHSPKLSLIVRCSHQFPPFHVLNEELSSGGGDKGMGGGCFWKPFEISQSDYDALKEEVLTDPDLDLVYDAELESKLDLRKWRGAVLTKHKPRRR